MRKFEIHLVLDEADNEAYEGETAQFIWDNIQYGDYINYYLLDASANRELYSGDTTHDNILEEIKTFLHGVRYLASEKIEVTYWVHYPNDIKVEVKEHF